MFQPSEAAKPFLVIVVSDLLRRHPDGAGPQTLLLDNLALTGIVCLLICQSEYQPAHRHSDAVLMVLPAPMKWIAVSSACGSWY